MHTTQSIRAVKGQAKIVCLTASDFASGGTSEALVVADMPFLSCQVSPEGSVPTYCSGVTGSTFPTDAHSY